MSEPSVDRNHSFFFRIVDIIASINFVDMEENVIINVGVLKESYNKI